MSAAIRRLRLIAEDAARRNEGSVLIAHAVKSTRGCAVPEIAWDGDEKPVWVVQVEGVERSR